MQVDENLLEYVAEIARLKLNGEEISKFLPQLKEILGLFSKLKEIDTENIKPSFHPVELRNVIREDKEGACLSQEDALSLTEHKKDNYFKGPRII